MNELTRSLSEAEQFQLQLAIEKLFLLQDRPIPQKKNVLFVEELAASGRPFEAIITAIKSLQAQDLKNLKIATILEAVDDLVEPSDLKATACQECGGSGMILMRDLERRVFSVACTCSNGRAQRQGKERLVLWNGTSRQESKGRTLTRY